MIDKKALLNVQESINIGKQIFQKNSSFTKQKLLSLKK